MKTYISAFVVVAVGMMDSSASSAPGNDMQSETLAIANRIERREIERVELLVIPARIATRTRITPEMLEQQYNYKTVIRDLRYDSAAEDLSRALMATKTETISESVDLRWGIVLYGEDARRIAAIYFDASGGRGLIDSTPVKFAGGLFAWVKSVAPNL